MPNVLAVIPARGGSKGIPRKNIALVGGRPLVAWTIGAARVSASVSRVLLSTDDEEIAAVGRQWGADVPFLRPAELASDEAGGEGAVLHALNWVIEHDQWQPDIVICLQPTSPLRSPEDIDNAVALLQRKGADSLVSITPADPHPLWTKSLDEEGWVSPFIPGKVPPRRQDLPPAYALNGALYIVRTAAFLAEKKFYAGRTCGYVMPAERSLDVDTPWDLRLVDLVMSTSHAPLA